MTGHVMTLEVEAGVIWLACQCGHQEVIGSVCTVKLVACLAESHKAASLIAAMERLGVGKGKGEKDGRKDAEDV